ncbi:MAG: ubiquinol-cytochrome c reductase iron-sulfur subunit [Candidatus Latescibacterota bacterium]|jgi:cytochrome b6-f complex iron-sulfur subunit
MGDTKNKKPPATAGISEPRMTRRSFFGKLWLAVGGVVVVEYALIAADFIRPHRRDEEEGVGVVVAGPEERFEPGSVTAFPEGRFYLSRLEDGGFLALSRRCTHLGCTVPWDSAQGLFVCPCHASAFDITGKVLSPPAPRPLDLYPVRIENGIVKVNTSERIKRSDFQPQQVTRA